MMRIMYLCFQEANEREKELNYDSNENSAVTCSHRLIEETCQIPLGCLQFWNVTERVRSELICVLFTEGNVYFIQAIFLNLLTQKYSILEKCPEAIVYEDQTFSYVIHI